MARSAVSRQASRCRAAARDPTGAVDGVPGALWTVPMTAIVGLVHKESVTIGGDSAGVSGLSLSVRADAKVFRKGRYLFGFTTSYRMGQLIRYSLQPPKPKGDLDAFMATRSSTRSGSA
jgi:hypothetical protein